MQDGVKAVVFYNNKVLLIKRDDGDRYTFPGGGIEEGENPLEALERELTEEIGIYPKHVSFVNKLEAASYTVYRYYCELDSLEYSKIKLGSEGERIEWFDYNELISNVEIHPDMLNFFRNNSLDKLKNYKTR